MNPDRVAEIREHILARLEVDGRIGGDIFSLTWQHEANWVDKYLTRVAVALGLEEPELVSGYLQTEDGSTAVVTGDLVVLTPTRLLRAPLQLVRDQSSGQLGVSSTVRIVRRSEVQVVEILDVDTAIDHQGWPRHIRAQLTVGEDVIKLPLSATPYGGVASTVADIVSSLLSER